jgi:protoporphyrinogen oxidase
VSAPQRHLYDCVVIGGGLTGLTAAAELSKRGLNVFLLEKDETLGGLAGGFRAGTFELEKFYHHWFTSDRHIMELVREIGTSDRIVTRSSNTGMYYAGSFFRLSTPFDLIRFDAIPMLDRIRTGIATLVVRKVRNWRKLEDITAKQWLIRWMGQKSFRVIWEPLLVGKFGAYADDISAVWFWKKLALRGSSRGNSGGEELAYYRGGFAHLARDVADRVRKQGGEIVTGMAATSIADLGRGVVRVETDRGPILARSALLTTPLPIAADLLEAAANPSYIESLRKIDHLGNICLILELDRGLSGLYWTNVNDPTFPFVGIIEHTNLEPTDSYEGRHVVYLSKYLPVDDPLYSMNAEQAVAFALPHIRRLFPQFDTSWVKNSYVWRSPHAQPIVVRRYSDLIPKFETPVPSTFLCTMAQVYPEDRGTNYAVREGKMAASKIHAYLASTLASVFERDKDSTIATLGET